MLNIVVRTTNQLDYRIGAEASLNYSIMAIVNRKNTHSIYITPTDPEYMDKSSKSQEKV
jgi:hypothetical protein